MKKFLPFLFAVFLVTNTFAQNGVPAQNAIQQTNGQTKDSFKIVFQLTSSDTTAHKALMKQIANTTTLSPGTQIEVVCHGPGLEMLQSEKSVVSKKIREHVAKGVSFVACEFSMKERKVTRDQLLPEAATVDGGILEIVRKQAQGWYYIKAGF